MLRARARTRNTSPVKIENVLHSYISTKMEIFEVTVVYPSTKTDTVFVQGDDRQELIKLQIEDKCGINPEAMSLYINNTCLGDEVISSYNIVNKTIIRLEVDLKKLVPRPGLSTIQESILRRA